MILYPAIDIYDGQCVRLAQGKFDQAKVYFPDPLDAARKWIGLGAQWLHVVDLNGALQGKPINQKIIEKIIDLKIPVQIGGGIRTREVAENYLKMGAGRVVMGSAAVEDPQLVQTLCISYKDRISVGLDAIDGKIAIHGWKKVLDQEAIPVAQGFAKMGIGAVIYTDISRDGMLTGPNVEALQKMIREVKIPVIASGGISAIDDLKKLVAIGAGGAILGRSLYENTIDLKEALTLCSQKG